MRLPIMMIAGVIALGACAPIKQELRTSGGYPGAKLDNMMFDASRSKQLHLLRYAVVLAMATQVADATTADGKDGDAVVDYLSGATEEFNDAAAALHLGPGNACPTDAQACRFARTRFEAQLPRLEASTLRLVFAALPRARAAAFASSLQHGDVAAAAFRALRLAASSIDGARRGAAVYRSSLEVLALMVAEQNGCRSGLGPNAIATVNVAVDCLGLRHDTLANPPDMASMPTEVPTAAFDVLFDVMRTSCRRLPVNISTNPDEPEEARTAVLARRAELCGAIAFSPRRRFEGMEAEPGPISVPAIR